MNGEITLSKRNLSGLVKGSFSTLDVKSLQVKEDFDIHSDQIKLLSDSKTSHSQVLALDEHKHITTVDRVSDLSFANTVKFDESMLLKRQLPVGGYISFPPWPAVGSTQKYLRGDGTWDVLLDADEKLPKGTVSSYGTFGLSDLPSIPATKITVNSINISAPPTTDPQHNFLSATGTWVQMLDQSNQLHADKLPANVLFNTIQSNVGSHLTMDTNQANDHLFLKANGQTMLECKANNVARTIEVEANFRATTNKPLRLESVDATKYICIDGDLSFSTYVVGGFETDTMRLTNLATSDPEIAGAIYRSGDFLKISNGPP